VSRPMIDTEEGRNLYNRVLAVAVKLFMQRGYFNTSVQDIQRESGVSLSTIYRHFSAKQAIAEALYRHLLSELENVVDDAMLSHGKTYDRGRAFVADLFRMTEDDPHAMNFLFNTRHHEVLPDEEPVCETRAFQKIRDIVRRGMEAGEIRSMNLWVAVSCLFGPPVRLMQLRLDGTLAEPIAPFAEEIWDAAWAGVRSDVQRPTLAGGLL
jgi:TetR/AcrR family transcriptional regulator, repressor of fatR-cypB operon